MKTGRIGVVRAGFHQSVYSFPRSMQLNYGSKETAAKNNRGGGYVGDRGRMTKKWRLFPFRRSEFTWGWIIEEKVHSELNWKRDGEEIKNHRLSCSVKSPVKHSAFQNPPISFVPHWIPCRTKYQLVCEIKPSSTTSPWHGEQEEELKASIKHSEVLFSLLCERSLTCYWFASSACPKINSCSTVICMHELWSCHCIMRACSNIQKCSESRVMAHLFTIFKINHVCFFLKC